MKETKYIIRRIIIGVCIALCLMFIKSCNVNASTYDMSVCFNGDCNNQLYFDGGRNINVKITYNGLYLPSLSEFPRFGYIQMCTDADISSYYSNNTTYLNNINIIDTNISCQLTASSTIQYITFNTNWDCGADGSHCTFDNTLVFYQQSSSNYKLLSYVFSDVLPEIDYSSGTIINQNKTIINQNDTIINNQNQINSNLTDETGPNLNGLENAAGWLKPGPVDSIINLPLTVLNNLQTNLGNTCNPVNVTLPFVDKDITLPCISSLYKQIEGLNPWFQGVGVIAAAVILYKYFIYLYKRVDDILTLRENTMEGYFEDSLWGGM